MKLAILIGVAKYSHPICELPACKSDVVLMGQLLRATGKFDDILDISTETGSSHIKSQLAQFVSKYKGQQVEEMFFYYSGHGDLYREDFYYILSDFTESRRNQTALTNTELDAMLKTLTPQLTIKVVDACHAGVTYVKDVEALTKQLQSSQGRFADCYFMFSSQFNQSSYQDNKISDFTKKFIEACTSFGGSEIRYRDIVDHISDAFSSNSDQTPTFVIQAPCVEVFCTINEQIRQLISTESVFSNSIKQADIDSKSSIAALIQLKAKEYLSKVELLEFIESLETRVRSSAFSSDLNGLYKLTTETSESYEGMPSMDTLGKWVEENGSDYFARATHREETYEAQEPLMSGMMVTRIAYETKTVIKRRRVVHGIDCTADVPFKSLRVMASPQFENLPHGIACLTFVFTKRDFVLFYQFQSVKETDWGQLSPLQNGKWSYLSIVTTEDMNAVNITQSVITYFEKFMLKTACDKLGIDEETLRGAAEPKTQDKAAEPPRKPRKKKQS